MAGFSAEDLVRALEKRGVQARLTGDDAVWTRVGDDYQAEVRLKGGAWWLHTPAVGETTLVSKAVGKAATSEVEQVAERLVIVMRQHWPIRLPSATPEVHEIPLVESRQAGPLGELVEVMAGPAGLAGQLRLESGPGWGYATMTGGFGTLRVSTDGRDYFLDLTPPGGGSQTFVVGRAGDEHAAARRVVATVRALVGGAHRSVGSDPLADLHQVLAHLPGELGAKVTRTFGGEPWIEVPGSDTIRAARVGVTNRLIMGELAADTVVFGSLGSLPAAGIADEVMSRLRCTSEEQEYSAEAWAVEGPELARRLRRLSEDLESAEDSPAVRGARAQVAEAQQQLAEMAERGGLDALVAAHRLANDLEDPAGIPSRGAPPAPRLVRHWADAEAAAAAWMEWFGFGSARVCGGPGDGGVDVRAQTAVAQVKDYGAPIAVGPVRELAGAALVEGVDAVFFARSGYTRDAVDFADRAGIALFQFDLQGTVTASNPAARRLMFRD